MCKGCIIHPSPPAVIKKIYSGRRYIQYTLQQTPVIIKKQILQPPTVYTNKKL